MCSEALANGSEVMLSVILSARSRAVFPGAWVWCCHVEKADGDKWEANVHMPDAMIVFTFI